MEDFESLSGNRMAERDGFDHDQLFQLVATERHPAILHEFGHGEELVCGLSLHPAGELQELPG
ncbi:MAG: hypothetical protein KC588_12555 [Nitrospira sp.]|nr:hypothetical protein [Nitrospira sp.]